MTAFHELGQEFFENISLFNSTLTNGMMGELKPIATTILAIFLLWRAIQYMMGSTTKPIAEVAIEIMIWAIIWGFVFNTSYLSMVTNGMNEIYTWAGGGISFFDKLDTWWDQLFKIADTLYSKDGSYIFPGRGVFALGIVILAALIITGVPFFVIIFTSIYMQLLIMVAPFMLLSFIFPAIQKMFYNWIESFLRVVLTVLIISLIQSAMVIKINTMLNGFYKLSASTEAGTIIGTAAIIFLTCLLYAAIMALAVPLANLLSGAHKSIGFGQGV